MALDYVLNYPCEVRKAIPDIKLSLFVGYKSLVDFAVAEIRKSNPSISNEIIKNYQIGVSQRRPDGITEQVPMRIGDLMERVQSIDKYKVYCSDCRACVADREFGCYAKINYPIKREVEEWLLARLPDDPNNPDLLLLFRYLSDLKIDGRPIDQLRSQIFEAKSSLRRGWESKEGLKIISSSQIIYVLAFGGKIGPQQSLLYTKIFNLAGVLSEKHPPSSNIEQFKTLICAIVMSAQLQSEIEFDT